MRKGTYRRVQKAYALVKKGTAISKAVKAAGTNYSTYQKYIDQVRTHTNGESFKGTKTGTRREFVKDETEANLNAYDLAAGIVMNTNLTAIQKVRTVKAIYAMDTASHGKF